MSALETEVDIKPELCRQTSIEKNSKLYGCGICFYSTNIASHLQRHMRKHTGEKPYACKECPYRGSDAGLLKRHMRTHTGERPFACTLCSYRCSQACTLKEHMTVHTGKKPFPCAYCSYQCSRIGRLKEHMRKHVKKTDVRTETENNVQAESSVKPVESTMAPRIQPYVCTYCDYKCTVPSDLKDHIMVHSQKAGRARTKASFWDILKAHVKFDGTIYQCDICQFSSHIFQDLELHTKSHLAFKCTECESSFETTDSLKEHVKCRHLIKSFFFVCTECHFKCESLSELKQHKNEHLSFEVMNCDQCSFKGKSEADIKQHLVTHKSDKIYQCTACCEGFDSARALNVHADTHPDKTQFCPKLFFCNECEFTCGTKKSLKFHVKRHMKLIV